MNASEEKPFVSFCISCYKQEKYIVQALAGAFSQTYENMEIVVSDDCSPDGTADVIRREIEKYKAHGGKLPVVLNINEKNLGNLGNWVKLCELAKGELLIKADGDDISLPERTAKVVAAWVAAGKKHDIVSHGYIKIDGDGRVIGDSGARICFGCVSAYTQKPFRIFGKPQFFEAYDDDVWGHRIMLLEKAGLSSGAIPIQDKLVLYRQGAGLSTGGRSYVGWLESVLSHESKRVDQMIQDIDTIATALPPGLADKERAAAKSFGYAHLALYRLVSSNSFKKRFDSFHAVHKQIDLKNKGYWIHMLLLLPPWFRNPFLNIVSRANRAFRRFKYRKIKPFEMLEAK